MKLEQQIIYADKIYKIFHTEQEFIIHPAALGILPMSKAALQYSFSSMFHLEGYKLILDKITVTNDTANKQSSDGIEKHYEMNNLAVSYNGTILIGANPVKEYFIVNGKTECFSYQNVFELVFEDGILITTVDQSKAMLRIRKNIELGLRNLNNSKDKKCIVRFMNASFVGDYRISLFFHSRMKYLKDMKNKYIDTLLQSASLLKIDIAK